MLKYFLIVLLGLLVGSGLGFITLTYAKQLTRTDETKLIRAVIPQEKQVIGFLPYWLIQQADKEYSPYLTTLTYFGLTVDTDGHIQKYTDEAETEGEPGWVALSTGKVDAKLNDARKHNTSLSLLVFKGVNEEIEELLSDPETHADALIDDITPLMKEYHFKDLNIDIEHVGLATDEERSLFITFLKRLKSGMDKKHLGTLTVEITGDDLIKQNLSDPKRIANIADYIVIMAYDFHFIGSYVTGSVAPLSGGGKIAEYDTTIALQKALEIIPPEKIILGIPLYGYQWETVGETPRSPVIPGTGQTASQRRVEEQLKTCTNCQNGFDETAAEAYVIYHEDDEEIFDQIFYPDQRSTKAKVTLAQAHEIAGIALWALGYEGAGILEPLKDYKR